MTDEFLCIHCGRLMVPAPGIGKGWRHAGDLFVSCHPGHTDTGLAEPKESE